MKVEFNKRTEDRFTIGHKTKDFYNCAFLNEPKMLILDHLIYLISQEVNIKYGRSHFKGNRQD